MTFCLLLYPLFTCVNPDPQSSGIRIRIHNTAFTFSQTIYFSIYSLLALEKTDMYDYILTITFILHTRKAYRYLSMTALFNLLARKTYCRYLSPLMYPYIHSFTVQEKQCITACSFSCLSRTTVTAVFRCIAKYFLGDKQFEHEKSHTMSESLDQFDT